MTPENDNIRQAAVAGSFYPASASALREHLIPLLATTQHHPRPKALILPHAGHSYCATIAAPGLQRLHGHPFQRVVIICPTHRLACHGAALSTASHFATPLGNIPLDQATLTELCSHPALHFNDAVHENEHAIEVLLPYLQCILPPFSLIPIAAGNIAPNQLAEALTPLWMQQETLFILSSDLSHFLPYGDANRVDNTTCRAIIAGNNINHEQACGATAINTLQQLRITSKQPLKLLAYGNSGDHGGSHDSVVGYASFLLDG